MAKLIKPDKIAMTFRKNTRRLLVERLSDNAVSVCDTYSAAILDNEEFEKFHSKWNSYKSVKSIDLKTFYESGQTGIQGDNVIDEIETIDVVVPPLDDLVKLESLELASTTDNNSFFKTENDHLIVLNREVVEKVVCEYNLYAPRKNEKQALQPALYLEHASFLDDEFTDSLPDFLKTSYYINNKHDEPTDLVVKSFAMPVRPDYSSYNDLIKNLVKLKQVIERDSNCDQAEKQEDEFNPDKISA